MAGKIVPLLPLASLYLSMLALQMADASVPAIFVFGDSTVDVGNNNNLSTQAKANYPPHGIDFVLHKPTGRFSNGYNTADVLAQIMGFKRSPPPFLSLSNNELRRHARRGINFASASSGILEATGDIYGEHLSMGKQIEYFETVYANLQAQMGTNETKRFLSKSFFLISIGSNDLFEASTPNGSLDHILKGHFLESLGSEYECHLRKLYKLGARKFGIISIPPIGCCPSHRTLEACDNDLNGSAQKFHLATESILRGLSSDLEGFKYSLGNAYEMVIYVFQNPQIYGFKEIKTACCGKGKLNGESPCLPSSTLCSNRNESFFWDFYHPSQAASKLAAITLYGGPTNFVTPINFGQLAEDDY